MGTLAKMHNTAVGTQQSQGVYARQIINQAGNLVTAMPSMHPLMLDRNYGGDLTMSRQKNPEQLRLIIGDRKKIDSAGASIVEINSTPQMVQMQLDQAMQNPNSAMGQYINKVFQELSAKAAISMNPRQIPNAKRAAPGMQPPVDAQAELAQLELGQPIQRPIQMTPDIVALQQMSLPNPNDRYAQYGGAETMYDGSVPNFWYYDDPNTGKRMRLGGPTEGARVWVGDRMENQLRTRPLNGRFAKATDQPYTTGAESASGANAPEGMIYESQFGPNPTQY